MATIVGLDVGKSSIVACVLNTRPTEPGQFYIDTSDFPRLEANAAGIRQLLALKPDVAIMEPTGVNYSRLWGTHLARAGVEVRLVGHKELRNYRENLGLPDKDDDADALALACYYFDHCQNARRFLQIRDEVIVRIREIALRLAHLNRVQSPVINRLRQDLAWQFPEVMNVHSKRSPDIDIPLLWGWIAGLRKSQRYDRLYANSVGEGIKEPTKDAAKIFCSLQQQEAKLEKELRRYLDDSRFLPYRKVFREFGFGERVEAIILSQIYPIENFLGANGKPIVVIRKGKNSKKPTKRHLSQRRFVKSLGMAPTKEKSGDKSKVKVVGGSDICRKALWQWVYTRLEPRKAHFHSQIMRSLAAELLEKKAFKPVKLARSHVCARAAKLLFRELVKIPRPE